MTEYNLYSYNLSEGEMSADPFIAYSASTSWAFIAANTQFEGEPYMGYSHFLETILIIKQFENIATDTIANGGVVDAADLAAQKYANRYDYTLMEAIDPSAEDNVDFAAWAEALYLEKYFDYHVYEDSNLSRRGFTFEDLDDEDVNFEMS